MKAFAVFATIATLMVASPSIAQQYSYPQYNYERPVPREKDNTEAFVTGLILGTVLSQAVESQDRDRYRNRVYVQPRYEYRYNPRYRSYPYDPYYYERRRYHRH